MGGGEKEQGERGSAALGVQGEEVVEEKGERNEGGGDDMGVDLCGVFEAFGSGSGVEEVVQMSGSKRALASLSNPRLCLRTETEQVKLLLWLWVFFFFDCRYLREIPFITASKD
ncbi:hypothetical protein V6N11_046906 [Hibiscus sabdariffa]|uniref:Uncharacterized protein n=1 Tax=Hibiscus sabdariffa TaxID=183260 RepID=A0ABR2NCQ7_9ROSI